MNIFNRKHLSADERRQRRKKRKDNATDCATDGCGDCDPGCPFMIFVLFTTMANYSATAPVRNAPVLTRPALRLIRSYQTHVSANRAAVCNLSPTCSRFGYDILEANGLRGLVALRRRLQECRAAGHHRD